MIEEGSIKRFKLDYIKFHKPCNYLIDRRNTSYCDICKRTILKKEYGREFIARIILKTDAAEIPTNCRESALETILSRINLSVRMDIRDRIEGLRLNTYPTWYDEWLKIKKEIEQAVDEYYVASGRMIGLSGLRQSESKAFVVNEVVSISKRSALEVQRFVEGSQSELLSVTRDILCSYTESFDDEGNDPFVFYSKLVDAVRLKIGIRAVAETRGKAYHVFMDVNGHRRYPAKPVLVGGRAHKEVWVYRIYHTEGWKKNIAKTLKHLLSWEDRAVETTKA